MGWGGRLGERESEIKEREKERDNGERESDISFKKTFCLMNIRPQDFMRQKVFLNEISLGESVREYHCQK